MTIARAVAATRAPRRAASTFRLPLLYLALAAALAFGADAWFALSGPTPAADVSVERAVQAVNWGPLAIAFGWVDWLEGLRQVAAAGLGLLAVAIVNRRGLPLAIWGALSAPVYEVLELTVRRPRPPATLVHVLRHTAGWSFPSGHALFFTWFIAYLLLILGRRRLPRALYGAGWVLLAAVLALVAVGRVETAEHWPTDVAAGLFLGAGWTLFGLSFRRLSDPVLEG